MTTVSLPRDSYKVLAIQGLYNNDLQPRISTEIHGKYDHCGVQNYAGSHMYYKAKEQTGCCGPGRCGQNAYLTLQTRIYLYILTA